MEDKFYILIKSSKEVFNPNNKDFKIKSDYKFDEKTGEIETDRNSVYATRNEAEMFAECYTLIMLGDCQSREHIEKYFPETLKAAKALLQEIRKKVILKDKILSILKTVTDF